LFTPENERAERVAAPLILTTGAMPLHERIDRHLG
jgi:hypothetical protein